MSSKLYRDEGIVLRTYKFGEADRIIVLLTREHGKVRAVAKGVRKTRSKFGGRLEPLSCVQIQLHKGRELDVVNQVETVDSNATIFGDLDAMTEGIAILEAVDQLVPDREPVPEIYRMLTGARRTLLTRPSPIVVPAFLWKLLAAEGLRPQLDTCVACEEVIDSESGGTVRLHFDVDHGGLVCTSCRSGSNGGCTLSPSARELMRRILGGQLNEVLDELHVPSGQQLNDPVVNEVLEIATKAFEHHMERRLRSVGIFERE